jgi:hypothetical protein
LEDTGALYSYLVCLPTETNATFHFRGELNILSSGKDGVKSEYSYMTYKFSRFVLIIIEEPQFNGINMTLKTIVPMHVVSTKEIFYKDMNITAEFVLY